MKNFLNNSKIFSKTISFSINMLYTKISTFFPFKETALAIGVGNASQSFISKDLCRFKRNSKMCKIKREEFIFSELSSITGNVRNLT